MLTENHVMAQTVNWGYFFTNSDVIIKGTLPAPVEQDC